MLTVKSPKQQQNTLLQSLASTSHNKIRRLKLPQDAHSPGKHYILWPEDVPLLAPSSEVCAVFIQNKKHELKQNPSNHGNPETLPQHLAPHPQPERKGRKGNQQNENTNRTTETETRLGKRHHTAPLTGQG